MPVQQFLNIFKRNQTAFHNLCTTLSPPEGIEQLLWNGLKFCIEKPLPKPPLERTMERLTYDIRLKYFRKNDLDDDDNDAYNPKLYLKNSGWTPPKASPAIEKALKSFRQQIHQEVLSNLQSHDRKHNIPPKARLLLQHLRDNRDFIVLPTDKNLGPAILERSIYKQRCLIDHLSNEKTYQRLSLEEARTTLSLSIKKMVALIETHRESLPDNEVKYFDRCFKVRRRIPQFYCTPKVHKTPWKTRPIVSCINSRMGDLSKWVDVQLQSVVHLCPAYLKDSQSLLNRLQKMGKLPSSAVIVTADAVSMYTNINTQHGLQTLRNWLLLHEAELPRDFPTDMVIDAVELIMTNNVFQFDDTFWLQLSGTAMGTSLACIYATIYYSYHEETKLLTEFAQSNTAAEDALIYQQRRPALLLYARLIDDAVQIWDTAQFPPGLTLYNFVPQMEATMKFGDLDWEVEKPSREVNFLDLNIRLETDGSITTSTFVKPMNLHLYIPPHSAHPIGVLKSLIYGNLQRYWAQNSNRATFIATAGDFYGHLVNRGYKPEVLTPIFAEAGRAIDSKALNPTRTTRSSTSMPRSNRLFIHWEYHPRDINRTTIRQVYEQTLQPAIEASGTAINQLTIAYSVPRSLGRCLTKTQLEETPGERVSDTVEQLGQPPANL